MSQCLTCAHGSRGAIENALSRGISYRTVARRWGLGVGSISRHNRSHVPAALRDRISARRLGGVEKSLQELKRDEGDNLLRLLVAQRARLGNVADRARAKNNFLGESGAEKLVLANLVTTARLLGELSTGSTTTVQNLIIAPAYLALRAALLQALSPPEYAKARAAVSAALRRVETAPVDEPAATLAIAGPSR